MYNAAVWLSKVQEVRGDSLQIDWRYFSLEQINQKVGPDFKVWEQPDDYPSKGLWSLRAAEAARRQGDEAFQRLHMKLLRARHEDRREIDNLDVLVAVAQESGLDVLRFQADLRDRSLLQAVARDHTESVEKYGAFGTPTFVFENGGAAYVKMLRPPDDEAVGVFDNLVELMQGRLYVGEVKRPQPPWPKGAYSR